MYGNWTIIGKPHKGKVICKCTCGYVCLRRLYDLERGWSHRCQGCANRRSTTDKLEDLLLDHFTNGEPRGGFSRIAREVGTSRQTVRDLAIRMKINLPERIDRAAKRSCLPSSGR